jgi:hypothetical protein
MSSLQFITRKLAALQKVNLKTIADAVLQHPYSM